MVAPATVKACARYGRRLWLVKRAALNQVRKFSDGLFPMKPAIAKDEKRTNVGVVTMLKRGDKYSYKKLKRVKVDWRLKESGPQSRETTLAITASVGSKTQAGLAGLRVAGS